MKKIIIIFLIIMLLCGCNNKLKLEEIIEDNNYIIVDVREQDEYEKSHIKNSINIPLNEISKYNFSKEKTILVYCQSGKRSKTAYNILTNLGYNTYDLGAFDNINMEKS